MQDDELSRCARACYEARLRGGEDERTAIEAALALWCEHRPDVSVGAAREALARVIARARLEARTGRPFEEIAKETIH